MYLLYVKLIILSSPTDEIDNFTINSKGLYYGINQTVIVFKLCFTSCDGTEMVLSFWVRCCLFICVFKLGALLLSLGWYIGFWAIGNSSI